MKKLALLLLAIPAPALAVEGAPYTYVGGGGLVAEYDSDAASQTANLGGFYAKIGHMFTRRFGIEGRALTTNDDTVGLKNFNVDATVEVEQAFSLFARWNALQGRNWAVYGLLGGTTGEGKVEAAGFSATEDDSDISFGIGVDLYGSESVAVTADAIRYMDQSDFRIWGASLGLQARF